MLTIPGRKGCLCDGPTRRELLRVGSVGLFGLNLANFFQWQKALGASRLEGAQGFNSAKSVILVFLQGGPSHIDIWDPKPDAPTSVRGEFKPINTNVSGIQLSETMPMLAQQMDKCTLIRSMSYTPNGLFNHTAAIYQMLTGYPADAVSPSGQLEPPTPRDFPTCGSHIARLKPPRVAMLPFVMMPRPLQESNVVGKGGTAGFLGRAYDPYLLYPNGDDIDQNRMDDITIDALQLRPEITADGLTRRSSMRDTIAKGMPAMEKAVAKYDLDEYYGKR